MPIIHRLEQPRRLLLERQIKCRMHRPDSEIEPAEDAVGQVEAAVFEDIDFDRAQHNEAGQGFIEPGDLVDLTGEALDIEAACDRYPLAVIGDRDIGVAMFLCSACHLGQRGVAVARVGVDMQVAADVGECYQMWQPSLARGLDLAVVLAQFRLDIGQAEPAVDFFFRFCGDR